MSDPMNRVVRRFIAADNESRPPNSDDFCSSACLLGLLRGLDLDPSCPNIQLHGRKHISVPSFQDGMRKMFRSELTECQLIYDWDLEDPEWTGKWFRARLPTWGYVVLAKGAAHAHAGVTQLEQEVQVYERLHDLQGKNVPVYLGSLELVQPFSTEDGIEIAFLLLLSWEGLPMDLEDVDLVRAAHAQAGLLNMHAAGVLHGNINVKKLLFVPHNKRVMWHDFSRGIKRTNETASALTWEEGHKRKMIWYDTEESLRMEEIIWMKILTLAARLRAMLNNGEVKKEDEEKAFQEVDGLEYLLDSIEGTAGKLVDHLIEHVPWSVGR